MTVRDLQHKMGEHLKSLGSKRRPYKCNHVKNLLKEQFSSELIFTSFERRSNIVVFRETAEKILYNFHEAQSKSPDNENNHILVSAAKLIKSEILNVYDDKDSYPAPEDLANPSVQFDYLTSGLQTFLTTILGDKTVIKAAIGQAIMQNTRPRAIIAPLQIGLAVQVHHLTGSRLLADQIHSLGFQLPYHEVLTYEKSAAVNQGGQLPKEFNNDTHTLHLHADNADDQIATLDGLDQMHSMGMMASISPGIHSDRARRIKRKIGVTQEDLRAVSAIPIHIYDWDGRTPGLKYETVDIPSPEIDRSKFYQNINLLHNLAWSCPDPEIPLFSGFMSNIHNGFASTIDPRSGDQMDPASFIFLPFINMDPKDLTCIESTLHYFADYCQKYGITPIVTFDRQLWNEAFKLIKSKPDTNLLKNIVLLLGCFHVELSFLGTIGTLMEGSGIEDGLEQIVAKNSIPHVMNGKNQERSFRSHMIAATSLEVLLIHKVLYPTTVVDTCVDPDESQQLDDDDIGDIDVDVPDIPESTHSDLEEDESEGDEEDEMDFDDDIEELAKPIDHGKMQEFIHNVSTDNMPTIFSASDHQDDPSATPTTSQFSSKVNDLLTELHEGSLSYQDVVQSDVLAMIHEKIQEWKNNMKINKTIKLWIQYLDLIALLKDHRNYERTGQFELQLQTLDRMRPCLASTGHHQYAKAITLFLNDMMHIKNDRPDMWKKLLKTPVVRHSYSRWAGLHTDLIIEQVLMCALKSIGGLAHGRGWRECQQIAWLLSRPACAEYHHSLQELISAKDDSKQSTPTTHKWSTPARKNRDKKDVDKMTYFFTKFDPFKQDLTLRCITTGVVAHSSVNVDDAHAIGIRILEEMTGKEVDEYTFPVSLKVKTLTIRPPVTIGGKQVNIDPQLLFQRLSLSTTTQTESGRTKSFCLELCSYAPNLFDNKLMMRTGAKNELADALWNEAKRENIKVKSENYEDPSKKNIRHIVDGGSLIHRIPWTKKVMTWGKLLDIYVQYVIRVYGTNTAVVFDNYPEIPTTKDEAHIRRAGTSTSTNVRIQENLTVDISENAFLVNKANAKKLIMLLSKRLTEAGIKCSHAKADADRLITLSALECAKDYETVVHAEDTDVLILLLHMATRNLKDIIFIPHLKKASKKKKRLWPIQDIQESLGDNLCRRLLLIHAYSGCDTTSRPYGMGKSSVLKKLLNDNDLGKCADTFVQPLSSKSQIIEAGDIAMRLLTGGSKKDTLGVHRYKEYKRRVMKGNKVVSPEYLPPTSGATEQHSLRVCHQIMAWLGIDLPAEEYGWELKNNSYRAKFTNEPPAPEDLLKAIFCNCKSECNTKHCTCNKFNLMCTDLCGTCQGLTCANISQDR